jgi:hypothetical protein
MWQEPLRGYFGYHLFARNDTRGPMRITTVSVYECDNIVGGCLQWDPDLVLAPGERRRLYTIIPMNAQKAYRFRWRAASAGVRPGEVRPTVVEPPGPETDARLARIERAAGCYRATLGEWIVPPRDPIAQTPPTLFELTTAHAPPEAGAFARVARPPISMNSVPPVWTAFGDSVTITWSGSPTAGVLVRGIMDADSMMGTATALFKEPPPPPWPVAPIKARRIPCN